MTTQKQNFFNYLYFLLTLLLLAVMICCTFVGCSPKIINQKQTENVVILKRSDSVVTASISLPINDTVFIQIPVVRTLKPDCDSLIASELDQALSKLNYRKQSGNNTAGIFYDKYKKLLVQYQKTGESKQENKAVSKTKYVTITKIKTVEKPIKYIPKWIIVLAGIGVVSMVYIGYRISRIWA